MMSRMYQTNLGGFDINKQELEQKQKQEQEVAQEWWWMLMLIARPTLTCFTLVCEHLASQNKN